MLFYNLILKHKFSSFNVSDLNLLGCGVFFVLYLLVIFLKVNLLRIMAQCMTEFFPPFPFQ